MSSSVRVYIYISEHWYILLLYPFCRIDGIVIAKEYKEVLLEAWEQEQQIIIEKDVQVISHFV